jgi:hypothetical protein
MSVTPKITAPYFSTKLLEPSILSQTFRTLSGVSDGARTRDIPDHNRVLYQLSYAHHVEESITRWSLPRSLESMSRGIRTVLAG